MFKAMMKAASYRTSSQENDDEDTLASNVLLASETTSDHGETMTSSVDALIATSIAVPLEENERADDNDVNFEHEDLENVTLDATYDASVISTLQYRSI